MNGTILQYSTSVRYLGVTIMNTMSWEMQVTIMANKIHSVLYQLKLCKNLSPESLRAKLVVALAVPHVDYCCTAYTDMTSEQNLKLHRAVNSCIRYIYSVRRDEHITPFYERLGWLRIDARRNYFVGYLLFSILQTQQPSLLRANYSLKVPLSDRTTRAPRDTLLQPHCRTELFKRSFRVTSIRMWNDLPSSIKEAKTLAEFKNRLYAHLLSRSE